MKYYQALVVMSRSAEGEILSVRISATYFKNEAAAKERYGDSFYCLATTSKHVIELPKPNRVRKEVEA